MTATSPGLRGAVIVCGTASDAGKSLVVQGLCRLLARRGVRVAPFKAQNMSLNSYVTAAGQEIGRAQAAQAMAAGIEPEVSMNPVLLKPTEGMSSQLVVMGRPLAEVDFAHYRAQKSSLRQVVLGALSDLRSRFDVVVCEGAGSAAEINLLEGDIVNLPFAFDAGLPAIVVGDIDRGGVFAALYGTVALLPAGYRALVRGFVINKLRGDASLLEPGLEELQGRSGVPTLGVLPWLEGVHLDAEDSLALNRPRPRPDGAGGAETLEVAVLGMPHISNFTDLDPLCIEPGVEVRMVTTTAFGDPDLLILPGTKATVDDLAWMRERGLDRAVAAAAARPDGPVILGICGGYQILGCQIHDDFESRRGRCDGLALLDVETFFGASKVTRQRQGSALGCDVAGYQIHHGRTRRGPEGRPWLVLDEEGGAEQEGSRSADGRVLGTTLHGIFETDDFRWSFLAEVARLRGRPFAARPTNFAAARRAQFDRLADALETHLDIQALEGIISSSSLHRTTPVRPSESDEETVVLRRWDGPWSPEDPDANFKADVALYSHQDPMATIRGLSANMDLPVGAVVRYVLAKYATSGSAGLLELGPSMVHRLFEPIEAAERQATDTARLRGYDQLRQMITWLRLPLIDDSSYPTSPR